MYISQTPLSILLATYNSSKYLSQQLDSLFSQSYREWTLYVRDDGSTDDTMYILLKYKAIYENIVIVDDDCGGLGAKDNFMTLLEAVDSQYYMFCDHDDIWLKDKVEVTMNAIQKSEGSNPGMAVVAHTDLKIVDANLNVLSDSMWRYSKIKPEILKRRNYSMAGTFMTGCTMGFNKVAKCELAIDMPKSALMHDWWIAIQAIYKHAVIITIDRATILYRVHPTQEVSAQKMTLNYCVNKLKSIGVVISEYNEFYKLAKSIGYGSIFKYYCFKMLYLIRRNL